MNIICFIIHFGLLSRYSASLFYTRDVMLLFTQLEIEIKLTLIILKTIIRNSIQPLLFIVLCWYQIVCDVVGFLDIFIHFPFIKSNLSLPQLNLFALNVC